MPRQAQTCYNTGERLTQPDPGKFLTWRSREAKMAKQGREKAMAAAREPFPDPGTGLEHVPGRGRRSTPLSSSVSTGTPKPLFQSCSKLPVSILEFRPASLIFASVPAQENNVAI